MLFLQPAVARFPMQAMPKAVQHPLSLRTKVNDMGSFGAYQPASGFIARQQGFEPQREGDSQAGLTDRVGDYVYLMSICRGDRAAVAELLGVFVQSVQEDMDAWTNACMESDWRMAGKLSHKLRSGFHQVGETAISHRLAEIEVQARQEADAASLGALCTQLLPLISVAIARAELCARNAHQQ